MNRGAWICAECGEPVPYATDRAEERVEYRSADGRTRIANVTVRRLCKKHARSECERIRARVNGTSRAVPAEQLVLGGLG
jgi:hypothetical protein